jgi:hypothetical protein
MKLKLMKTGSIFILFAAVACGGLSNDPNPRIKISKASKSGSPTAAPATGGGTASGAGGAAGGAAGGGNAGGGAASGGGGGGAASGGGGGGAAASPADAAAQALKNTSGALGTADIDFGSLLNSAGGSVAVGSSRTAQEMVINTSKKTALTITSISIEGANPGDFTVDAASVSAALASAVPANKSAFVLLPVTFSPTDAGTRSATLQIVSNAGTAVANLTGVGVADAPVLGGIPGLSFLPDSAPDTINVENFGGSTLALQSIAVAGANPEAFQIVATNAGQSNCFAGELLGPQQLCLLGIGVAPGATGPASATLTILSNDPATPETDIPLTLTPAADPAPAPAPAPAPVDPAPAPVDPTPVP